MTEGVDNGSIDHSMIDNLLVYLRGQNVPRHGMWISLLLPFQCSEDELVGA